MEDLMTRPYDIEGLRVMFLGNSFGIDNSANDVQHTLNSAIREGHLGLHSCETFEEYSVYHRNDSTEPQGNEHTCPIWSPSWGTESIQDRESERNEPEATQKPEIESHGFRFAIVTIVDRRKERANAIT